MEKRGENKRASIELSFGMIFSIILVIAFLAVAFYAVKKFLDFQNDLKIEQFKDNLQKDIDDLYTSPEGNYSVTYSLPAKVQAVCFRDDAYDNLVFKPDTISGKLINHIDIGKTLAGNTNLCYNNANGKISILMSKDYGDNLVTLK
ncbi:MAG TPA: hypothetical protein VMC80_01830 [Patescibacteria group bacterium]|nr:hypothetical protein [Patescibacteria group bacterium]